MYIKALAPGTDKWKKLSYFSFLLFPHFPFKVRTPQTYVQSCHINFFPISFKSASLLHALQKHLCHQSLVTCM